MSEHRGLVSSDRARGQLRLTSEFIETGLSTWIDFEMFTQCLAHVLRAKRTALDVSLHGAGPNLALHAA